MRKYKAVVEEKRQQADDKVKHVLETGGRRLHVFFVWVKCLHVCVAFLRRHRCSRFFAKTFHASWTPVIYFLSGADRPICYHF